MFRKFCTTAAVLACFASASVAGLIDTRTDTTLDGAAVDGVLSPNEYGLGNAYSYTGGGGGFGGTVGGGTLYFESDATNLYLGFQPGNNLNDFIFMLVDSKSGGFVDADMNDQGDEGRRAISNPTANAQNAYPAGFLPDYGITIGQYGIGLFELNAGNSPNHLNFVSWDGGPAGTGSNFRETSFPLSAMSIGSFFDFLMGYTAGSAYQSNESIPASAGLNGGGNPGFGDTGTPGYENFDRFNVPEPATLTLVAFGAIAMIRRRR